MTTLAQRYRTYAWRSIPKLPRLYVQARRVLKYIPKLPEATDTTGSIAGRSEDPIRVLLVGESTVAGVGVRSHREGLAGHFCKSLSEATGRTVAWKVVARSGYTVQRINDELLAQHAAGEFDLAIVGIGANDAFKLSTLRHWQRSLERLIAHLKDVVASAPIYFLSLPPIEEFPALPQELKNFLVESIDIFSEDLAERVLSDEQLWFDDRVLALHEWETRTGIKGSEHYFSDGVHPSETTYRLWALEALDYIMESGMLQLENLAIDK
ncbi:MAG: SGNH/GDSL hydrolase family protein [Saprospiraceae bacterium]|nr:SGNH/GDSL hydrolase family protein [Saprospiraceae bacterium]